MNFSSEPLQSLESNEHLQWAFPMGISNEYLQWASSVCRLARWSSAPFRRPDRAGSSEIQQLNVVWALHPVVNTAPHDVRYAVQYDAKNWVRASKSEDVTTVAQKMHRRASNWLDLDDCETRYLILTVLFISRLVGSTAVNAMACYSPALHSLACWTLTVRTMHPFYTCMALRVV